jgi:hypothetical protein
VGAAGALTTLCRDVLVSREAKDVSERSSAVRRVLVGAAGLALAATACSAGQLAQTSTVRPGIDGASAQIGPIALRDIVLVYPEAGKYDAGASARLEFVAVNDGSLPDTITEIRSSAADQVQLGSSGVPTTTPSGTDTTGSQTAAPSGSAGSSTAGSSSAGSSAPGSAPVTSPSATSPSATDIAPIPAPAPVQIELPAGAAVSFRTDDGPAALLLGLKKALLPSQRVSVTFVLKNAGEVTVTVPVAGSGTPVPGVTIDVEPTESG